MPIGKPVDQERQVSESYTYDDQRTPGPTMETAPVSAQDNLNDVRTMIRLITGELTWPTEPPESLKSLLVLIEANLTPGEHESLRQLIHFIDCGPTAGFASGAVLVDSPAGDPFPTSATWYTDATRTKKLVEQTIVYGLSKAQVVQSTWVMYDEDGATPVETVVDVIEYEGRSPFPLQATRTIL